MVRPLRLEYGGAWYHVMNRGSGYCTVFHDDGQRQRCFDDLLECSGLETHTWCLMGRHNHLLLHTPYANPSRDMRHLDGVYSLHSNPTMTTEVRRPKGYPAFIEDIGMDAAVSSPEAYGSTEMPDDEDFRISGSGRSRGNVRATSYLAPFRGEQNVWLIRYGCESLMPVAAERTG